MKQKWVQKNEGTRRLVLIFAGWGSDDALYRDIAPAGWDVMVCWDFDGEEFDAESLKRYTTIYLYAWSLGVNAASRLLREIDFAAAFAVNGTEWPCDDLRGIPSAIFHGTANTLSEQNLHRFRRRMVGSKGDFEALLPLLPAQPDIDDLRRQLELVANQIPSEKGADFWTRAYISTFDRIFPSEAQRRAWEGRGVEICEREGAHYVSLASIVANTIPNPEIVGRKFSASLPTYDENASAQRRIVDHLVALMSTANPPEEGRVLEIGQGSGLSTECFGRLLRPAEMDCVDLYPTPHLNAAPTMRYHVADAERWLQETDERWDVIVSSSAIQWFADVKGFIATAAHHLTEDGMLACATFAPGNLKEFDSLRPAPMLYRRPEELERWLRRHFREVQVECEEIRITFSSAKEALRHLKLTGVGGSGRNGVEIGRLLQAVPMDEEGRHYLTYRPVYLITRGKKSF